MLIDKVYNILCSLVLIKYFDAESILFMYSIAIDGASVYCKNITKICFFKCRPYAFIT